MQTASYRIWTRMAESISFDYNYYTTSVSLRSKQMAIIIK